MNFRIFRRVLGASLAICLLSSCAEEAPPESSISAVTTIDPRPEIYADFTLTADLSELSDSQREMIGLLIEASVIMDDLFWRQAYGDDYKSFLDSLGVGPAREFAGLFFWLVP